MGMFWVSEQRLADPANTVGRNSWITELEIEELERKLTGSDSVIEAKHLETLPDHIEDARNVLLEMSRRRRGCHCYGNCRSGREGSERQALRNVPKKKLLEKIKFAKVDKALSKFKIHLLQRLINC